MEVRFLQQFAESLLSHDVPDRHVDVGSPVRPIQFDLFLRDLRAERRDVPVVELILDESSDEAGLADCALPDKAELYLHVLAAHSCFSGWGSRTTILSLFSHFISGVFFYIRPIRIA